jgi:hypothetical protein
MHLRIVIAVFLVGGTAALMPYALSLFSEDVKPFPFGWVGGLSSIALALWLSRGSNIARALLILFSCLGLAFYGYLALMVGSRSWTTAAFLGVFALISAYSLWALAFSQDVRVELARRGDKNLDDKRPELSDELGRKQDCRVEKLRSLLTPSGQTAQPQLLVAVVSDLPIEALKPAVLDKADRLFGVIFAETQQANTLVNAAVKYFKLN